MGGVSLLVGCGSATQNVRVADVNAPIPLGKSIVELHRTPNFYGGGRGLDIYDNGKLIGDIRNDTKLIWERDSNNVMCLNTEQTFEKYIVNPLLTMLLDPQEPNCFRVIDGQLNQYKYDYVKGLVFTQEEYVKLLKKEKIEMKAARESGDLL